MFDLDRAIHEWRNEMARGGVGSPELLGELESHLREDIARQTQAGEGFDMAFASAVERIGSANELKTEFRKAGMKTWNRKIAYVAWALYAVSFFLPSYLEARGWQCAVLQNVFWDGAKRGEWASIHYELLTLANLVMLASPFLLFRVGLNIGSMKWFRALTLSAMVLVWWWIGLLLANADGRDLRVGCFVWGASFILLPLCSFVRRTKTEKLQYA